MVTGNWDELRGLGFAESYPGEDASERLIDEMLFQRASQVVLWSLPAISMWAMKKGSEAVFGSGSHVLVVWKDRLNASTVISTPNSDVIYALGYLDLASDGPTVVEVPPRQQGILDDFWQRPITDVGFVGPDQGEGAGICCCRRGTPGRCPSTPSTSRPRTWRCEDRWHRWASSRGSRSSPTSACATS